VTTTAPRKKMSSAAKLVITAIAALVLTTGGVFVLQSVKASDRQHEMQDQRQCFLDNYGNPAAIRDKC